MQFLLENDFIHTFLSKFSFEKHSEIIKNLVIIAIYYSKTMINTDNIFEELKRIANKITKKTESNFNLKDEIQEIKKELTFLNENISKTARCYEKPNYNNNENINNFSKKKKKTRINRNLDDSQIKKILYPEKEWTRSPIRQKPKKIPFIPQKNELKNQKSTKHPYKSVKSKIKDQINYHKKLKNTYDNFLVKYSSPENKHLSETQFLNADNLSDNNNSPKRDIYYDEQKTISPVKDNSLKISKIQMKNGNGFSNIKEITSNIKPKTLQFEENSLKKSWEKGYESNDESSISSNFSMFEPNEELKSFYQKEMWLQN